MKSQLTILGALLTPVLVFAHGEVDDGHVEEVVVVTQGGSSALLQAFSPEWWGLFVVSTFLTVGLSFAVWKYMQVPQVMSSPVPPASPTPPLPAEKTIDHLDLI